MADKAVVVEFDFAALDGAEILFETTRKFLLDLDMIPFDDRLEAQYLSGKPYLAGLTKYFAAVKTKKTALKASHDLAQAFVTDLSARLKTAITPGFKNFVKAVSDRGVKVILVTRGTIDAVADAFEGILGERVALCRELCDAYGCADRLSWGRACVAARVHRNAALAVTGSGFGVRSALLAGLPSMVVERERAVWQDVSGANAVVRDLNAAAAKTALAVLGIR